MEVYLDNAATTKPLESVIDIALQMFQETYGNPSSMHEMGIKAEAVIKTAAKQIARVMGCMPEEIFFTSGGTESDNMAIFGAVRAREKRGKHIITTAVEHPAVAQPIKALEDQGYEVTRLKPCAEGPIDLSELERAVRGDTVFVSIQHVNNETGIIQDISSAAKIVKERNIETVFHSDGVQALCKLDIDMKNIDLYSVSAHKLHALKGTGALYIKKGIRILPLMLGGGQQGGLRSGTENTVGIAAFGIAAEECAKTMTSSREYVENLRNKLIASLEEITGLCINGEKIYCSPYIVNISFGGIRAETLLNALDAEGVYVSAGAACSSRKRKNVLDNFGFGAERAESAIRFSFSKFNTEEEINYCAEVLRKVVPCLRLSKPGTAARPEVLCK